MSDVFGRIVTGTQVARVMQATAQTWMTTYLAEVERQEGLDPQTLTPVRSWVQMADFATLPENATPACVTVSPELDRIEKPGGRDASYTQWWRGRTFVVVAGTTIEDVRLRIGCYCAALTALLVQQRPQPDMVSEVEVTGQDLDGLRENKPAARTLGAGSVAWRVRVPDALRRSCLLAQPPDDPYAVGDAPSTVESWMATVHPRDEGPQ